MEKTWNITALVLAIFVFGIMVGGICIAASVHRGPVPDQPDPEIPQLQYPASIDTTAAPVPTETPHSIYMYSTARGYQYHPDGFVCTENSPTYLSGPEGVIGIWCERGQLP